MYFTNLKLSVEYRSNWLVKNFMENQSTTPDNQWECTCEGECINISRCCFCNKKICKTTIIKWKCESPWFNKMIWDVRVKAYVQCHEKKVDEILNKK